jgi:hypothetical protein
VVTHTGGWQFDPSSRTVGPLSDDKDNVDFTGYKYVTVSGHARTSGGTAIANVHVHGETTDAHGPIDGDTNSAGFYRSNIFLWHWHGTITAAQLKDDVQNWLGGDPIVAKSPNPVYVLRKWAGRHRYGAAILGSLLVILCSFASLSLHFYHGKNEYGKENKQLKAALDDRNQLLIYQDPFFAFLEGWRSPKPEKAAAAASLRNRLPPRSLYRSAADFLLDPNAAGRIESFRAELPPQASWLADWMVAEVRRKCQDHPGAIAAYKKCHEAMSTAQGRPFQQYVEAALYRLMSDPGDSLSPRERPTGKEKP